MGGFLKNNWTWIIAPFVLLAIIVLVVVLSMKGTFKGKDEDARFIYNTL